MDENGMPDRLEDSIAALRNPETGVNAAVQIVRYEGVTPRVARVDILDAYGLASPLNYRFPEGVFSFRIEGLTPGSRIEVKFYLSQPFQEGDVWWKYDTIRGWQPYATAGEEGGRIIAGVGTDQVTLEFVDGGHGDADGVANGIIVDPSGPGRQGSDLDPGSGGGGGGGGCFIATASYGTELAQEVRLLSNFRDRYLLTNRAGQVLVKLYYRHSPPAADFIRDKEPLKKIVRWSLRPIIEIARWLDDGAEECLE